MLDNKIKKNLVYNSISQLIIVLVPLITAPYVARKLNVELIGNYNFCYAIVSFFALFANVSISNTGISYVAKVKNDKVELTKIFYELMIIKTIFTVFTLIAYLIFIRVYNELNLYFAIMTIQIVATFIDITWFFQGLENFKLIFVRTILLRLILLVCTFLFINGEEDIYIYVWINVLSLFIPNLFLYFSLRKYICKINVKELHPFKYIKTIVLLFLPGIAYFLYSIVDKTMIKFITNGTTEVGYYEQAYKIAFIGITLMSVFGTVFSSRIAGMKDDDEIRNLHKSSISIVLFFSGLLFIGLFFLSDYFIPFYYGSGYEKSIRVLQAFSILPLIMGISNFISYQYFIPKLMTKPSIIFVSLALVINIVLNLFLIKKYGAFGACIATIISESFISLSFFIIYNRFNPIKNIIRIILKYAITISLLLLAFYYVLKFLPCDSILLFLFYIGCISISYVLMLLILREELIYAPFKQIINKIWRKKNE